jgi:hypothetical protein
VLAGFVYLLAQRACKPVEQELSDGTILRIEMVTFGTNHVFSSDPIREKVRNALPKRFRSWLGKAAPSYRMETLPNCLVLWTTRFDPMSGTYIRPLSEGHYATDEHGCRFRSSLRQGATIAGKGISGVVFGAYPRSSKDFDYLICDQSENVVGKVNVPNPFRAKPKPWHAEMLPIAKTNAQLVAELERLRRSDAPAGVSWDIQLRRPEDREFWEKGPQWICDVSGNRIQGGRLCTNDSAWKIEVDFFRKSRAEFRADEIWVITNVPVPKAGEIIALKRTNTLQGCRVAVGSLKGGSGEGIPPEPVTLSLSATYWNKAVRILVRARDQADWQLTARAREDPGLSSVHWNQDFNIYPLQGSKTMDIEILVQKPVKLEFFVDPLGRRSDP